MIQKKQKKPSTRRTQKKLTKAMKGSPPAAPLQVITVYLITTMVFLTLVSAENMETFNKRFTGRPITFTLFATTIPFAASSPVGAGLNHGGMEGSLIHTHLAMETTPSLLSRVQLMLSSATSLQVQAMPITPTLTPTPRPTSPSC